MAFVIITDSASDTPESIVEEYGLYVMPTPVTIDGEDLRDRVSIFPDEFYKLQEDGTHEIKTYHISQLMFEEHFTKFAEQGDEVLYICFSTGVAGTFQAATLAKEEVLEKYPDFKITIIDSHCASVGYGLVVERLLKMQKNGAPQELIIEAAHFFCEHMEHIIIVQSLDYLYAGGRVSKASFVVGGMLDIKPIITVDENGALKGTEKVRGWKKAQARMIEMVGEKGVNLDKQVVAMCYGTDKATMDTIKEEIKKQYKVRGFYESQVGCAVGAHTGPSIIGCTFLNAFEPKYDEYLK